MLVRSSLDLLKLPYSFSQLELLLGEDFRREASARGLELTDEELEALHRARILVPMFRLTRDPQPAKRAFASNVVLGGRLTHWVAPTLETLKILRSSGRLHDPAADPGPRGTGRSRGTSGARQRLDAQDTNNQALATRAPPVRPALHPDQQLVAKPRRALVRRAHHQKAQTLSTPLRSRAQQRHPGMERDLERRPQTLHMDKDRRPHQRIHHALLHNNCRLTTPSSACAAFRAKRW
jgi:hypothetical protein